MLNVKENQREGETEGKTGIKYEKAKRNRGGVWERRKEKNGL
jgi:hypothetical protein